MNNRYIPLLISAGLLFGILALAGLTWGNYRYASQNPGGDQFLPLWVGTRLFITEGQSPYSQETTLAIQEQAYGREARADEDPLPFLYPFYSFLNFFPFALIEDYLLARALWMTVLEMSLFLTTAISLSLSRWRISTSLLGVLLIFTALWYHSVRPIMSGNPAVLCGLFLAGGFLAVRNDHDVIGGVLFALAGIKPQTVIFLYPFILMWASSNRRGVLFWSLVSTLVFMIAGTSILIPDWTFQNLRQIVMFREFMPSSTPGRIFFEALPGVGAQMGWVLTVFAGGILFWEWRAALGKDTRWFFWTACLTLVLTNLMGIPSATENYVLFYPGLVLVLTVWDQRWGKVGRWLVLISIMALLFGLWGLYLITLQNVSPYQHPIMYFPLPFFMLAGLYWVRWWAIRPPPPLLDQLKTEEGVLV